MRGVEIIEPPEGGDVRKNNWLEYLSDIQFELIDGVVCLSEVFLMKCVVVVCKWIMLPWIPK